MKSMERKKSFSPEDIRAFEPETKIGILATVTPEGRPHITLITTILAGGADTLIWGQFTQGQSKEHVLNNSKTGFLIMTMDRNIWRGKADWTHALNEGEEYEKMNTLPMWRYNSYFGIHRVHYMDLVETTEKQPLPLAKIVLSTLLTKFSQSGAAAEAEEGMNSWTKSLFKRLDALKFLSFIGKDGYPVLIPLLQGQTAGSRHIVFHPGVYGDELSNLEAGCDCAVFGMTLDMEDVLVRGTFQGFKRFRGTTLGVVEIDWVYNAMPPLAGQIYPEVKIQKVENL